MDKCVFSALQYSNVFWFKVRVAVGLMKLYMYMHVQNSCVVFFFPSTLHTWNAINSYLR